MFFPRLRRQVKWMFVFLALAFTVGFVVFNVGGAGPSGGIGDLLRPTGGLAGPSSGEAREKIEDNPKDPQGYRELATALQNEGKIDEAIPTLEEYVRMKPGDTEAKRNRATLYLQKAGRLRREVEAVQLEAQSNPAAFGGTFAPAPGTTIGRALGTNPVNEATSQLVNERLTNAYTKMQDAYRGAVRVYRQLAGAAPRDPALQLELAQAAEAAGDTTTALAAYRRFVRLAPEDPTTPAIKQRIRQLAQPAPVPPQSAG